jgi:hypothetical protein
MGFKDFFNKLVHMFLKPLRRFIFMESFKYTYIHYIITPQKKLNHSLVQTLCIDEFVTNYG